jgi:hypothetical protein
MSEFFRSPGPRRGYAELLPITWWYPAWWGISPWASPYWSSSFTDAPR